MLALHVPLTCVEYALSRVILQFTFDPREMAGKALQSRHTCRGDCPAHSIFQAKLTTSALREQQIRQPNAEHRQMFERQRPLEGFLALHTTTVSYWAFSTCILHWYQRSIKAARAMRQNHRKRSLSCFVRYACNFLRFLFGYRCSETRCSECKDRGGSLSTVRSLNPLRATNYSGWLHGR